MAERRGPVGYGSPKEDVPIQRREDFNRRFPLLPNSRADPLWPKCTHRLDAVVQVGDDSVHGGRRFFRCPNSGEAKCGFARWIDPQHDAHMAVYMGTMWERIWEFEARLESLQEENDDLRQQVNRERGNEEVVNIGSSYDPSCCCANPSCICACHSRDGEPRPRRPPMEHSTWVPRGTFYQ